MQAAVPQGEKAAEKVFDVGIEGRLSYDQLLILGLQNIFGMTGMFVFPGILGRSFNLAPEQIAYLYGMTFLVCGIATILQSVWLLRLPIVQGPYAGSFATLLVVGHLQGGLGAAYGSFFVAALIWCLLSVPIYGFSVIGLFSRFLRAPIIAGMVVIFIMIQVSNVALPGWIGLPQSPGFPAVNFLCGALAVAVLIAVSVWGGKFRRASILIGLAAGTIAYALFRPVSLAAVMNAPLFVAPKLFPFGYEVQADLVIVFLLVLLPASVGSMALCCLLRCLRHPLRVDRRPHPARGRRHVDMVDAERLERIENGADHCGWRTSGASFASAFDAEWIGCRRHLGQLRYKLRKVLGARHGVVLETAGDELAIAVERDRFHQRLAYALGDAAVNLACA
jgi:hypothetical protein